MDGPLGDVVADLLIAEQRFDALIEGAPSLSTRPGADAAVRAEIFCAVANVQEGLDMVTGALKMWRKAATIAEVPHVALNCIVGLLRASRKLGARISADDRVSAGRVFDRMMKQGRQLFELRVLARETVAELGGRTELVSENSRHFLSLSETLLRTGDAFPSAIQDPERSKGSADGSSDDRSGTCASFRTFRAS
jgi:hypothetical protein